MYDPSVGRFISSDPAKAGTNWYAYCENDPLECADPSGLDGWGDIGNFLIGLGKGIANSFIPDGGMIVPTTILRPEDYGPFFNTPGKPIFDIGSSEQEQSGSQIGLAFGSALQLAEMAIPGVGEEEAGVAASRPNIPELPPSTIARRGEITIEHYHGSIAGEHGPPHAHVNGGGAPTKIGMNGKPLKGFPELSRPQQNLVNDSLPQIKKVLMKVGRWHRYYNPKK